MRFLKFVRKNIVPSLVSFCRLFYTAGQAFFGSQAVAAYFSKLISKPFTNVLGFVYSGICITAAVLINAGTRVPQIFQIFSPKKKSLLRSSFDSQDDYASLRRSGKFIFHASNFSTEVSGLVQALQAYFGSIIMSEFIASQARTDAHDEAWKEALVQTTAVIIAMTSLATFYAYDKKILKHDGFVIAKLLQDRDFNFDTQTKKTLTKTLLSVSLQLLASPFLAFFWTEPAIRIIPGMERYLGELPIKMLTSICGFSAFTAGVTATVSDYQFFSLKKSDPNNNLKNSKLLLGTTMTFGGIDSTAAALGNGAGFVIACNQLFKINPYGPILIAAIPIGISFGLRNMTFSVAPGYEEWLAKKQEKEVNKKSLLAENTQEEIDDEPEAQPINDDIILNIKEALSPSFYKRADQIGLIFKNEPSGLPRPAKKQEVPQLKRSESFS